MTKSKHSTESDIDTRKIKDKPGRWLRVKGPEANLGHLMDFYWGGPERRITTLTLRIIGVNAVALLILVLGVVSLSEYQQDLIEVKLLNFQKEVVLVSTAITQSAFDQNFVNKNKLRESVEELQAILGKQIIIFDHEGSLLLNSTDAFGPVEDRLYRGKRPAMIIRMASYLLSLMPDVKELPLSPDVSVTNALEHPDSSIAMVGELSMSAWEDESGKIILSGAAPLIKNNEIAGSVMIIRGGQDIEQDIGRIWQNILVVFFVTLIITTFLSIYLSGTIASPLKKLARAAEGVRKGKLSYDDIPDFSHRLDEIGELSVALRSMTHALSDRMDSIDRFAADVAHELKNPLTSLRSAVETASIAKKKSDQERLIEIIKNDVNRLTRLISDISNASRLDSALSRERLEPLDLKIVLNQMLDVYKTPLERKGGDQRIPQSDLVTMDGIKISLELPKEETMFVWGLKGRLDQVLQNLIGNALSFSKKGQTIWITTDVFSNQIHVHVKDEGVGIPENKLETIFERFYSQRPDAEEYGKHSGLGLSICKQIIEATGGMIFAKNRKDSEGNILGAHFTVVLDKV